MKNQTKSYLFALAAVILWSTVATAFKIALRSVDYIQLLFFSTLVALVASAAILTAEKGWHQLRTLSPKSFLLTATLGFLNPFVYYLILFKAYSVIPAQAAMTLNYTWPIMLVLLSIPILKQPIGWKGLISVLVSFSGVVLIATKGNLQTFDMSNLFGYSLALSSSVVWAVFWLINLKSNIGESLKLFLSFGFGLLFITPVTMFTTGFPSLTMPISLSLIYVGLAEMGITFWLWINALKHTNRTDKVSKLIFLSPFFSLFFISIFLGEKIELMTIIGLLLIMAGIVWKEKGSPR